MAETLEALIAQMRNVHHPSRCVNQHCVIHNPSIHLMNDWPAIMRESTLIERLCEHGVGHPDPDSAAALTKLHICDFSVHGCDGCCTGNGPMPSPLARLMLAYEEGQCTEQEYLERLEELL